MLYSYGRTEDIPYGQLWETTFGLQLGEFKTRGYFDIQFAKGNFDSNFNYYSARIGLGSYLYKNKLEEGTIDINLLFISKLYVIKQFKARQFLKIRHTGGFRKLAGDSIILNSSNGIRGLNHDDLYGNRRFIVNYESMLFAPWNIYEFKFALNIFADMGFIGHNSPFFQNSFYSGFGIGFNLKNENLVFPAFQIRFAFYPEVPQGYSQFDWEFAESARLRLQDFSGTVPSLISFE